jgi:hypothetical protein
VHIGNFSVRCSEVKQHGAILGMQLWGPREANRWGVDSQPEMIRAIACNENMPGA